LSSWLLQAAWGIRIELVVCLYLLLHYEFFKGLEIAENSLGKAATSTVNVLKRALCVILNNPALGLSIAAAGSSALVCLYVNAIVDILRCSFWE
jgi:hypothetical protein